MNLLLIVPRRGPLYPLLLKRLFYIPSLTAATIASLTPAGNQITIVDENVKNFSWHDYTRLSIDLVGISVHTQSAPRAYQLADFFRAKGVTVVLGGIHVSALPQEALKHADAVVIGEAEDLWQRLIEDFTSGRLEKIYQSERFPCLEDRPLPRLDLLSYKSLFNLQTIQTSRGCPYNCAFCSASKFYGLKPRQRSVSSIIDELRQRSCRYVFFVDEHLTAVEEYAKELFAALAKLKIAWGAQAHISVASNQELLNLARHSGCRMLMLGFDSVLNDSLRGVRKQHNQPENYVKAVREIKKAGIAVAGAFMLGFDQDDKDIFDKTVAMAVEMGIDVAYFFILTPYPGTELYQQFQRQRRIIDRDWSKYDCSHVVFQPKQMSPSQLLDGFGWSWKKFYTTKKVLDRLAKRPNLVVIAYNLFYFVAWRFHLSKYLSVDKR